MALYINGEQIKSFKEVSGLTMNEEDLALELPGHILIDEKQMTKWVGDLTDEETEMLRNIMRIDCDMFAGKRVRIYLQSLGPIPRTGR